LGDKPGCKQTGPTNGRAATKLERTTFRTSRLLDFFSEKELVNQTGHAVPEWPLVVIKELVDNGLDACEDNGISPVITVQVDAGGITVTDNGPGIPADTVEAVLDFEVRVSSREAYVSPCRGAQGNALKTLLPMPYVLSGGTEGRVEIAAQGCRHEITMRVDHIHQRAEINHQQHLDPTVTTGTSIRISWPGDSPRSILENGRAQFLQIADDQPDSPRSILQNAKARFLQIADDYTFLNPHLTLTVEWFGERTQTEAGNCGWKKWLPSSPTCPLWYGPEHFDRLVAAYLAHDADQGRDRTVRELVAEFAGLTGTAKQREVLQETDLARVNLSALKKGNDLDHELTARLLAAMKKRAKAIKPAALGVIGKDHLAARFGALGCDMETFKYIKKLEVEDDLPVVVETAFACPPPEARARRLITGVNWSPGIVNPFRKLGRFGQSLDSILEQQRAGGGEPIVLLVHLARPRVEYANRGKTEVLLGGPANEEEE
jgi:DNA topoisomerase VI subunit B